LTTCTQCSSSNEACCLMRIETFKNEITYGRAPILWFFPTDKIAILCPIKQDFIRLIFMPDPDEGGGGPSKACTTGVLDGLHCRQGPQLYAIGSCTHFNTIAKRRLDMHLCWQGSSHHLLYWDIKLCHNVPSRCIQVYICYSEKMCSQSL
jgi:hypothetical protein